MSTLAARRRRSIDFWPGFVDALSSLLMVLVFLLLLFTIGQFVLSDALRGRDDALSRLNAQLAQLADVLALEKGAKAQALARVDELSASLSTTTAERDRLSVDLGTRTADLAAAAESLRASDERGAQLAVNIAALEQLKAQLESEVAKLVGSLEHTEAKLTAEQATSAQAIAQTELLNRQLAALRTQLEEITAALDLARAQNRTKDLRIDELGKELNLALANRVNELARYRSDFFGRLREVLGSRADIVIVGDRFVVPSELLFPSGSDELAPAGRTQLDQLAATLKEVTAEIPSEIDWVLRIDGHTDRRPIHTPRFPSNWELSAARAIAIVKYLVAQGIPAHRFAANGFGEFRPLDPGEGEAAYARNRRIEIQLTNR